LIVFVGLMMQSYNNFWFNASESY